MTAFRVAILTGFLFVAAAAFSDDSDNDDPPPPLLPSSESEEYTETLKGVFAVRSIDHGGKVAFEPPLCDGHVDALPQSRDDKDRRFILLSVAAATGAAVEARYEAPLDYDYQTHGCEIIGVAIVNE